MNNPVIVTTREDLAKVLADIMGSASRTEPAPEAVDLEVLNRKKLLTPKEVQRLYGLKAETLANKRAIGRGPEYIQDGCGNPVYYEHAAIERYLQACRKKSHDA